MRGGEDENLFSVKMGSLIERTVGVLLFAFVYMLEYCVRGR
jgi:hypothetical protein